VVYAANIILLGEKHNTIQKNTNILLGASKEITKEANAEKIKAFFLDLLTLEDETDRLS
jgi:hypothetical protein